MFKKILLPIDISDLNSWEKTLPLCVSMINNSQGAHLSILSIIPNFGVNMVEEYFPAGWKKEVTAKTLAELEKIVKKYVPEHITPSLLVGRGVVYQEILEYATKIEADLIVMSASHPNRSDYLLGPNVARVARHATISVLIQR
jgi:nucleotide-binding universal stress UspA family protein